jgi:hypothetical protein
MGPVTDIEFDHPPDPWWPLRAENGETWSRIAVVTHWGFITAGTRLKARDGAVLRIDSTWPHRRVDPLFLPGTR